MVAYMVANTNRKDKILALQSALKGDMSGMDKYRPWDLIQLKTDGSGLYIDPSGKNYDEGEYQAIQARARQHGKTLVLVKTYEKL